MQEHELSPGRRERKKRATRLALKAAALDLVSLNGYNHVTVEDIANAVDVSVRTFFNYFASKEDAIAGTDPDDLLVLRTELIGLPADLPPLEALRTVLTRRLEAMEEDIDMSGEDHTVWLRRLSAARSQPEVNAAFSKQSALTEQALVDALVERLGGDERLRGYASLVTACAVSAARVTGSLWAAGGGKPSLRELSGATFGLLGRGFAHNGAEQLPAVLLAASPVAGAGQPQGRAGREAHTA